MKRNLPAFLILLFLLGWGVYHYKGNSKMAAGGAVEDFALESLKGGLVKLSDYRGKPVLVNFWASWCQPCKNEMPELLNFSKAHPEIAVLAVNLTFTETNLDDVTHFAHIYNMPFPVLIDESGSIAGRFQIMEYPTSLLIGADGTMLKTIVGQTNRKTLEQVYSGIH